MSLKLIKTISRMENLDLKSKKIYSGITHKDKSEESIDKNVFSDKTTEFAVEINYGGKKISNVFITNLMRIFSFNSNYEIFQESHHLSKGFIKIHDANSKELLIDTYSSNLMENSFGNLQEVKRIRGLLEGSLLINKSNILGSSYNNFHKFVYFYQICILIVLKTFFEKEKYVSQKIIEFTNLKGIIEFNYEGFLSLSLFSLETDEITIDDLMPFINSAYINADSYIKKNLHSKDFETRLKNRIFLLENAVEKRKIIVDKLVFNELLSEAKLEDNFLSFNNFFKFLVVVPNHFNCDCYNLKNIEKLEIKDISIDEFSITANVSIETRFYKGIVNKNNSMFNVVRF